MAVFAWLASMPKSMVGDSWRRQIFPRTREIYSIALPVLLVAVSYFVGTKIGFALTPPKVAISTFWPPNAILLASLLLSPRKRWWALLLGALTAHLLAQLPAGVPSTTALGWFAGNAGEALIGAYLITRFVDPKHLFQGIRGVLIFLAFGVLAAPLITSFLDAAIVVGTGWGRNYWLLWFTRLFSNMLAEISLVPPIVILGNLGVSQLRRISFWRYMEAVSLASSAVLISIVVFAWEGATRNQIPILFYLLLPLWLWASIRFSVGGIGVSLLIVGIVATWLAVHGQGIFTSSSTLGSVLYLQVFLCVMSLPFLALAALLAQHRETTRSLRESRARLIDSQERERRRLARELHDGVGQSLALLESSLAQFTDESQAAQRPRLREFLREVSDISKVTREISHGLHPSHLEHLGLSGALKKLCRDFSQDRSVTAKLLDADLPQGLSSDISLAMYRVAQEALHNVEKYSHARQVEIRFKFQAGQLRMQIVDDGVGFAPMRNPATGIGIASMRERMELIGGSIEITSAPMKGTQVEAVVPVGSAA